MNRRTLALIAALLCSVNAAKADFAFTVGSGQTGFSFTASTGGTAICAASVTHCFASVPINTAGAAFFTSGAPGLVTLTGTNNIATVTTVTGVTTVSTVTTLSTLTGGGAASAAADSGNPVKIGGKYNSSPITLTDGNRGDLQLDVNGYAKVNVTNANTNVANNADTVAAGAGCCSPVASYPFLWNGSTWDRTPGTAALGLTSNVAKINGVTPLMGNGATGTGSPRVTIVSDGTAIATTGYMSVKLDQTTPGTTNSVSIGTDPCSFLAKTTLAIDQNADTQLFSGASSKKTYVCSIAIIAAAAEAVSLVVGTGTVCATNIVAMLGSTTDANGLSFAANGGITLGNGLATVAGGLGANADNVCLRQGGTSRLAGNLTYVQN